MAFRRLVDGLTDDELAELLDDDLPTALPVAERLADIPEGEPTAFIDKDRYITAFGMQRGFTFGVEEIAAPVGQWATFPSTWLAMARWDPVGEEQSIGYLYVQFLSLATVRYGNVPLAMWQEMIASKSKGQTIYYRFAQVGWPYILLSPPLRKVTQSMKDMHYQRTAHDGPDFHLRLT